MVGRKPASVLPAPVAATSSALRPRRPTSSIASWWRRGRQPLDSNQRWTTGGSESVFSAVGSLAPALFLFTVELMGRLLGVAALAGRAALHHQPDQRDQQDRRADDFHDPNQRFVHLPLLPREPRALNIYIVPHAAIGFLDRVPPRG